MTENKKTGYKRVYQKHGAYWFVDSANKWHRLCAVADGEPAMVRALARVKNPPESRPGSMSALIAMWRKERLPQYAASTQYDYALMLDTLDAALRDYDVAEIDSGHVIDIRDQWTDKPRTANKYHALISLLMSFAVAKKLRKTNPTLDVRRLPVPKRQRYINDDEFLKIIDGALIGDDKRRNATGPMMAALFRLAYLTALRLGDLRTLMWSQINETVITVTPAKTKATTGATIRIDITPEIAAVLDELRELRTVTPKQRRQSDPPRSPVTSMYVFHNRWGHPYSKDGIETAWERARRRAKVADAHFHDLRAKALTDADEAGVSLERIQQSAAHATPATTARYLKNRRIHRSALGLALPKQAGGRR